MATLKTLTGQPSDQLTLFVVDTPASLLASQDTETAQLTPDICFPLFLTPLAHYDHATQSWKMCGDISLWGEQPSLETLPPSGMTRNGRLFQLPRKTPRTSENASLLLPTPTAVTRPMEGNVRLYRAQVQAGLMTEAEANAILGKSVWEAQGKLPKMAPFPTMSAGGMGNTGSRAMLQSLVDSGVITQDEKLQMSAGSGGKLNPEWVEWLMGFPAGWTDLEP